LAVVAGSAYAVDVYAIDNLGTTNGGTIGDRLVRFDSANPAGTITVVGASGVASTLMGGLAFGGNGTLYGASQATSNIGMVYSVNTSTGAFSAIGNSGLANGIRDLAWDPFGGRMLALTQGASANAEIHSINLSNGSATLVSTLANTSSGLWIGLTVNSAGRVFVHDLVTDFMSEANLGAGTVAQMSSPIGVNTNFSQGMGTNWSAGDQWLLGAIGSSPGFFSQVMDINQGTGAGTIIGVPFPNNGSGGIPQYELGDLDFQPVPEPATILALGAGAAFLARRRRK
jgi:hypothetical protein